MQCVGRNYHRYMYKRYKYYNIDIGTNQDHMHMYISAIITMLHTDGQDLDQLMHTYSILMQKFTDIPYNQ